MGTLNSLYQNAGAYSERLQNQYLNMQAPIYGQLGVASRNAYQQTLDPTTAGLYNTMAQQAADGLASGRNLSAQEQRMAQGSARAAMASRGMQMGNQAIAAEVLNSYNFANAREDRAREFANKVYGVGQNNAAQAMSMYGQPLMAQMNAINPTGLLGQANAYSQALGPKLFQPESQYNAGIYGANQSNETQAALARSQAQAGLSAGLMGLAGNLGKGYLSNPNLFGGTQTTTSSSVSPTSVPPTTSYNSWMSGSGSLPTLSAPTYSFGG
jgi:hypothetical protein